MVKRIGSLVLLCVLAACASEPPVPPPAPLNFQGMGGIQLTTQDISMIDRASAQSRSPNDVTSAFRPTLLAAVQQWASDHLKATGQSGHAALIIKKASVIQRPLPIQHDFNSWFTRQQSSEYVGSIEVSIEARAPDGFFATAKAFAEHSVTLPEDPSQADKEAAYRRLLDALMEQLNGKFDGAMQQHMSRFIASRF